MSIISTLLMNKDHCVGLESQWVNNLQKIFDKSPTVFNIMRNKAINKPQSQSPPDSKLNQLVPP